MEARRRKLETGVGDSRLFGGIQRNYPGGPEWDRAAGAFDGAMSADQSHRENFPRVLPARRRAAG